MAHSDDVDLVSPGIWQVRVPLPIAHNPNAFLYVVEDAEGAPHLIDSGLDSPDGRTALATGLAAAGHRLEDIRSVTATHFHVDHLGLAGFVRDASGASVAMHGSEVVALSASRDPDEAALASWGVPREVVESFRGSPQSAAVAIEVDVSLDDGQLLPIPGRDLRVLHTPGHTTGHVCIVSDADRLVFTGDHLLPDQFPGIGVGGPQEGNPIRDYRDSLERVRRFEGYTALPGHGWAFDTISERVDQTLAHHQRRTDEVERARARHPEASVWQIAGQLTWTAGWAHLENVYLLSAVRQTAWHLDMLNP